MELREMVYAEAIQSTQCARTFIENADFWRIVLELLHEEDPDLYAPGELKRKEKDIRRRLANNIKAAERLNKRAERNMARYHRLQKKKEGADGSG